MSKDNNIEKEEEKTPKMNFLKRILMWYASEPFRNGLGIIFIFIGLYISFAVFSFFYTGWEDQSLLLGDYDNDYLSENIKNNAGLMGARISDFLINRTFGISVLSYIFYFFLIGLWFINVRPFEGKMYKTFMVCSFVMIWGSILLGSFIDGYDSTFLFLGGEHGYQINLFLQAHIGWTGVILILLLTLLLFSFYAFEGFWELFMSHVDKVFSKTEKISEPEPAVCENGDLNDSDGESSQSVDDKGEENIVKEEDIDDNNEEKNESAEQLDILSKDSAETSSDVKEERQDSLQEAEKPSTKSPITIPFEIENSEENNPIVSDYENTEKMSQSVSPQGSSDPAEPKEEEKTEEKEIEFSIEEGPVVEKAEEEEFKLYDPTKDLEFYQKPSLDLFKTYAPQQNINVEEQNKNKDRIVEVLNNFDVEITSIKATVGPTVTLYEVTPGPRVQVSRIRSLADDIALSIAAKGIRIIAPIPGKGTIGIEVPNTKSVTVPMSEIIGSKKFQDSDFQLPIALGKTITNEVFMLDLCKMPHVLVAGATGQGKSVGLNAIITSLLYKKHPSELKLVMVDPMMVEFSMYAPIENHFLAKMPDATDAIITDVKKVVETLNSLCVEMDQRYELLRDAGARHFIEYNEKFINRRLNPEKGHHFLPYIVVVIDEFADLIMQVGKEVEKPIARIAQKARAVGIHMILATQRPSANVITGVIRANFPARFAFRVSSSLESRVILDSNGAEQLIGRGDMLIGTGSDLTRVQCAFVDTPEVERITEFISKQQSYPTAFLLPEVESEEEGNDLSKVDLAKRDVLFAEAAQIVVSMQQGSISLLQRKFEIGFNRAGRIMDQLEVAGIVGPSRGAKPREVLVTDMVHLDSILNSL